MKRKIKSRLRKRHALGKNLFFFSANLLMNNCGFTIDSTWLGHANPEMEIENRKSLTLIQRKYFKAVFFPDKDPWVGGAVL